MLSSICYNGTEECWELLKRSQNCWDLNPLWHVESLSWTKAMPLLIFCLEIEWFPNSRLRKKKQQINFMVTCKFHIRGGSEAHNRNFFFYTVY